MNTISNKTFDLERVLYNLKDTIVSNCTFNGENDGESPLKETRNVKVINCDFSLRYPLWHANHFELIDSKMTDKSRAPIWYSHDGIIDKVEVLSVKMLRECSNVTIKNSKVISQEFGWYCNKIRVIDSTINSEYAFLNSKNIQIENIELLGKYSFQYVEELKITNSKFDTKDSFWHSKNVYVKDSVLKGEYLAWFSESLTLENCLIIGTQPFCYCTNLKLINCKMIDTDLSFEYSDVNAEIEGDVLSIKNPKSGKIVADSVGEIIKENSVIESNCEIIIRNS